MYTIAIDGPSGSGKTTTAKALARKLGWGYLDTGAMYRAVAVGCMEAGIYDPEGIAEYCRTMEVEISTDPDHPAIIVAGHDISEAIRAPETSAWVSKVSTNPECRINLVQRQKDIIASSNMVAEGRDITTVVAADAEVRILLTADAEARMSRRGAELGGKVDEAGLRDQVLRRDRDDSTLVNFTVAADGVVTINSTLMTLDEVVDQILSLAEHAGIPVQ
ncbi:MAG: (d)CMP kinase [Propionibacteriaceae bacterium]|jgi:cytidylate kinase|nr:(d)CMP kinase [Propionibacteriaceae bacterium]